MYVLCSERLTGGTGGINKLNFRLGKDCPVDLEAGAGGFIEERACSTGICRVECSGRSTRGS